MHSLFVGYTNRETHKKCRSSLKNFPQFSRQGDEKSWNSANSWAYSEDKVHFEIPKMYRIHWKIMRVRLFWSLKSKKTLKIFNFLTLSGKLEKIEVNGYHHRVLRLKLHKDKSNMPSQLCSTSWYSPSNLSRYPAGKLFDAPPPFIAVPMYESGKNILDPELREFDDQTPTSSLFAIFSHF